MACMAVAYTNMAGTVMANIVVVYIVMANIVVACVVYNLELCSRDWSAHNGARDSLFLVIFGAITNTP